MFHFLSFVGNFINVQCIQRSSEVTNAWLDDFSQSELIDVTSTQIKKQNPQRLQRFFQPLNSMFCGCADNFVCFLPGVNIMNFESMRPSRCFLSCRWVSTGRIFMLLTHPPENWVELLRAGPPGWQDTEQEMVVSAAGTVSPSHSRLFTLLTRLNSGGSLEPRQSSPSTWSSLVAYPCQDVSPLPLPVTLVS